MVSLCALSANASARRAALPQTGGWTMPAAHSSGELNDVVLRRNVLLVAIQHMNDLFAYNEQPGNNNFRHAHTDSLCCGGSATLAVATG